ncbi:MAG TPA: pre-peptidase C-terminal domain-containing protein, partial [Pirellulales bacterium]|nr:pre-peptidase C-terminal domain-containing protein [Pirellulales bacterium]
MIENASIAASGTYTVRVSGVGGTTGGYGLRLVLNAQVEVEPNNGTNNDTLATAEDIDGSFTSLGGAASRGAILGAIAGTGTNRLASEDFEAGVLPSSFTTYSSSPYGRIRVTAPLGYGDSSQYALLMDSSAVGQYALNEAVYTVDLNGILDAGLTFRHISYNDETHSLPADFVGHYNGDGVAISDDGIHWRTILSAPTNGTWMSTTVDLAAAAAAAGMTLGSNFKIKFQQYDDSPISSDGRGYDDITITAPQDVYRFDLAAGDTATLQATPSSGGAVGLTLVGPDGAALALGTAIAGNAGALISDFAVQTAGTYYAIVSGVSGSDYSLLVTRNADFNAAENYSAASAQELLGAQASGEQRVLGAVAGNVGGTAEAAWTDSGFWMNTGHHNSLNKNYLTGQFYGNEYRDFFVFGLPATNEPIVAAQLEVLNPLYVSSDPTETYSLFDVSTPIDQLRASGDGQTAIFNDLGSGVAYGSQTVSAADNQRYITVSLDPAGLAYLNSHQGQLAALGGAMTSLGGPYNQYAFAYSSGNSTNVRLLLTFGSSDVYRIHASAAGQAFHFATSTPADGGGQFVNNLDPQLRILDASGAPLTSDDNSGADGRNAALDFNAPAAGTYYVEVSPSPLTAQLTSGEYVLSVAGNTVTPPAFQASGADLPDGATLRIAPGAITVNFNDSLLLSTVSASDLTLDGVPAAGVTVLDGQTVRFDLPPGPIGDGTHTISIATGAISDIHGTPVNAFSTSFFVDTTPPRVTATSIAPGGVATPGSLSYQVTFSEPMQVGNLSADDFALHGDLRGANYAASGYFFNADGTVLTLNYANLPDDHYTLTLHSGVTGGGNFTDVVGNALDGEFSGSLPSGDGAAGGDFVVGFNLDPGAEAFPTTFKAVDPAGSLIYDPSMTRTIAYGGDTDGFTLSVDPDQTLTAVLEPAATLQGTIEVVDPAGNVVATATADAAGDKVVLQSAPVAGGGTYTVVVGGGAGGTTGLYQLQLVLNAQEELEQYRTSTSAVIDHASGFGDPSDLARNGAAVFTGGVARLTNGQQFEPASVFSNSRVNIDRFVSSFTFQFHGGTSPMADGMTFTIQGDSPGAIGPSGGALGYAGIANSVAVKFDLWNDAGEGYNSTGLFSNGANPSVPSINLDGTGINLQSGDAFRVDMNYHDGNVLDVTITDLQTGATAAQSYAVNIPALVGGDTAYVGFTASTGGWTTTTDIQSWTFGETTITADNSDNTLATAQNIDGSFLRLGGAATRGAVLGTTDAAAATDDYAFTMAAGDTATIVLTSFSGQAVQLALFGPGGVPEALENGNATNVCQLISDFAAPSSGTYYAVVSGTPDTDYSLVVMRNAAFDTEENSSAATAQNVLSQQAGGQQRVLGNVGGGGSGPIRVAVFGSSSSQASAVAAQLNDDTYFDFSATVVNSAAALDSPAELANYDVVILGDRYDYITAQMASALRTWVESGKGGVVGTGYAYYNTQIYGYSASERADLDAILPLNMSYSYAYTRYFGSLGITDPSNPITQGISDFGPYYGDTSFYGADSDAAVLGSYTSTPTISAKAAGEGRGVYLAPDYIYFDYYGNLRTGSADRLLEQAVHWAAPGDTADWYSVNVTDVSQPLQLATSTPADGPGAFANTLNPKLELYDPSGSLVASGGVAADGRNETIDYPPLTAGMYHVRVTAEGASHGEYVLSLAGNTVTAPPFQVTAIVPPDHAALRTVPGSVTVDFNESLMLSSVSDASLTVDGLDATGFTIVDATTIRFDIPVLPDGSHNLSIAAGAVSDIHGTPVDAFSSSFVTDTTPPWVTATSIAPNGVAAPGSLSYQVTFSEPMNVGNLSADDFALRGDLRGANYSASSYSFNADGTILTLNYANLPDDHYTLTLHSGASGGSNFTDVVGNALDGEFHGSLPSGDGTAGGDFVAGFSLDPGTESFPTTFQAVDPAGSLIYDPAITRTVAYGGDTDGFTLAIDPGQTLSVLVQPSTPGMLPTVELLDPSGAVLASVTASAAGQNALLQTVAITTGGVYTITVGGAGGTTGLYTAEATLNAALEAESNGGAANNTLATAQDINGSFLSLGGAASRGAVLGAADGVASGYTASAAPYSFEDIGATGQAILYNVDDGYAQVTPGGGFSFNFYGTNYSTLYVSSNGLITFGSGNNSLFNSSLTNDPTQPTIAPFWDDLVVNSFGSNPSVRWQLLGSGTSQELVIQWNNVRFFGGSYYNPITFEAVLSADGSIRFNYQDLTNGDYSADEGRSATVGIKDAGAQGLNRLLLAYNNGPNAYVGSGMSTLIAPVAATPDYYSFHLDAGASTTLALKAQVSAGASLELLDSAGAVIAAGSA